MSLRDPTMPSGPGAAGQNEIPENAAHSEGTDQKTGRQMRDLVAEAPPAESDLGPDAQIELVARIVGGDQQASVELLDLFQGRVWRMVRRMWSRDRQLVEDLTQEVFLRVFRGLPTFNGACNLGTWIHRITINVCISELRQRKALKRDRLTLSIDAPVSGDADDGLFLEPVAAGSQPAEQLEKRELYAQCRAAIDDLPELWRVILTLRDIEGRSYEEIAEILDLPIGTVRSRLHRARVRVRKKIEGSTAEGTA